MVHGVLNRPQRQARNEQQMSQQVIGFKEMLEGIKDKQDQTSKQVNNLYDSITNLTVNDAL